MPQANKFTIHIMAAVAEQEAEAISKRTFAALKVAKAKGKVLGGRRVPPAAWSAIAEQGRAAAAVGKARNAEAFRGSFIPVVDEIRSKGVHTLYGIAAKLNLRGEMTRRGGKWSPVQVHRVLTGRIR